MQPLQQTQLQPPFGQSVDSLCHPWFTTTKVSYRFPILKLPPPPCAVLLVIIHIYIYVCIYASFSILGISIKSSSAHITKITLSVRSHYIRLNTLELLLKWLQTFEPQYNHNIYSRCPFSLFVHFRAPAMATGRPWKSWSRRGRPRQGLAQGARGPREPREPRGLRKARGAAWGLEGVFFFPMWAAG